MKRFTLISFLSALFSLFIFSSVSYAVAPTKYTIYFGGTTGNLYAPNSLTVEVGDTVIWNGDFSLRPLDSSIVPSGAKALAPITSGMSYMYIIEVPGLYEYRNKAWGGLGMKGTINGVYRPHGSITNAGREFFLGMIWPTYMNIANSSLVSKYATYALITTYYENTVYVSYYDQSGELTPKKYTMLPHTLLQVPLEYAKMRLDSNPETPAYKAVHITSKNPVSVQYQSRGANSGGSYLALPVLGVGKKYVAASYNDNAKSGGLIGGNGQPRNYDLAGGSFMIIATDDVTAVSITPTTKTSGGKTGGFSTQLSKGQCYLVRSDGSDGSHDLSGSIIQASKPIIVISGHEDAFIGDGSNATLEQRDLMVEQMVPVEYWDTMGYVSIPFTGTTATSNTGGIGDTYRVYTFDPGIAKVQADVNGIPGGYDMSVSPLGVAEHLDITSPVDIYSTNGHKISVMEYDERSQGSKKPYPAPSMMTVVPHSRWRTTYNFSTFDPVGGGLGATNPNQYVNVIADSISQVKVSIDGGPEGPLTNIGTSVGSHSNISSRYSSTPLKGNRYDVGSHNFYLHSDYPFICYGYGMSETGFGFGMFFLNFEYEHAAPLGMQLNSGVTPSFKFTVTELSKCSGWNICVTDEGTDNPGVKAVQLVDDYDGVYYQRPGLRSGNVSFDKTLPEYWSGELRPFMESKQSYCFHVNIDDPLKESTAPVGIIDNNGNGLLIRLHRSAPTVALSTASAQAPKPDSIFFPEQTVGNKICTTFVVRNTAPVGGSALSFTSADFKHSDASFSLGTITPALPASIQPQQDLTIEVCYTAKDVLRHLDTLVINNDCFSIPISLDAHSATGLISAEDISFGILDTGKTTSKTLLIKNIGSAPFTLKTGPVLSDPLNFDIDPAFLATLPRMIDKGKSVTATVIFHPKVTGDATGRIDWSTDIDASFATSGKSYSTLTGTGKEVLGGGAVRGSGSAANSFNVRPNPASGNFATVSFSLPEKNKATINIYDLLGRELYKREIKQGSAEFELPLSYLPRGVYHVRLTSDGVVMTQKLEVLK